MRIFMKLGLFAFLLCVTLALAVQAQAQNLEDACGDTRANFNVKTDKKPQEPAPPAAGMAQIVLIETLNKCSECGNRSEEHTSELQSLRHLVCRLLLEK